MESIFIGRNTPLPHRRFSLFRRHLLWQNDNKISPAMGFVLRLNISMLIA